MNELKGFTENDLNGLDWPERRKFAQQLCEHIKSGDRSEERLRLFERLALDPKWEVRLDIAHNLLNIPEERFWKLVPTLEKDTNSFVLNALKRAVNKLACKKKERKKYEKSLGCIDGMRLKIKKQHGPEAAEKAFRMTERLYDVMNGSIVHDMLGILTPIKSGAETISICFDEGWDDREKIGRALNSMSKCIYLMERLLGDMRSYSKQTPRERKTERLIDVVNESHKLALDFFESKDMDVHHISLGIDITENITLDIARHQIVEVFYNLIRNAYESFATGPGSFRSGGISVSAEIANGNSVRIAVSDNGMGLNEDELCHVRRFVPGGTSKKMTGTGFGLPIARRKISDHGGTLEIDSEEGEETTVTVTLPLKNGRNDNNDTCSDS
ncbi:MAG: hypothetical protein A2020_11895 [Lentisphaerae bacterium GWF2_45_14]|nr:MAG: hypothetical protein A2020_11895 [Lentisphaerae bacterium GWF2_45_14]